MSKLSKEIYWLGITYFDELNLKSCLHSSHCDHIKDKFRDFVSLSRKVHQLDVESFPEDSITQKNASQKIFLHGGVLLTVGEFQNNYRGIKNSCGKFGIPRIKGALKKTGGLKNITGKPFHGVCYRRIF